MRQFISCKHLQAVNGHLCCVSFWIPLFSYVSSVVLSHSENIASWWQWAHEIKRNVLQGPLGSSFMWRGSGLHSPPTAWQPWHVLQKFSASLSMLGHQTFVRSHCFIFSPFLDVLHGLIQSLFFHFPLVPLFLFLSGRYFQKDKVHLGLASNLGSWNSPNFQSWYTLVGFLTHHQLHSLFQSFFSSYGLWHSGVRYKSDVLFSNIPCPCFFDLCKAWQCICNVQWPRQIFHWKSGIRLQPENPTFNSCWRPGPCGIDEFKRFVISPWLKFYSIEINMEFLTGPHNCQCVLFSWQIRSFHNKLHGSLRCTLVLGLAPNPLDWHRQ